MSRLNRSTLLAEDAEEEKLGVPMRFGYPFDVNYNLMNSGSWETLDDGGRLWRLKIECPGAYSINLVYERFRLPEGARLYLYSEDQSMVIGAFSSQNNKPYDRFSTAPVKGEVCILEYYVPAGLSHPGEIEISRIVHGYRDIFFSDRSKDADGFNGSGSCNNNVHCPEGDPWQNEIRSVAMIINGGGYRWCSGAMVNNVRQDLTPYFLTADHCLGSEPDWVIMFNYESPNCDNINGPTWMTISGTTLRAANDFSDFALVELSEAPPDSYNVYYAGWTNVDVASSQSVAIHHPSGDIKKISFDYDPVTSTSYLSAAAGDNSHWRIGQWEDGTTEGGSSGSPLFDPDHRIVGQLHGGYASCTSITSDWYGKFSKSWNHGASAASRLSDWLDPDNTGADVLDGRGSGGVRISHVPLTDTRDFLNPYEAVAIIGADTFLADGAQRVTYDAGSGWVHETMTATGVDDGYSGFIPAQSPGTDVTYYIYGEDLLGNVDSTDMITFKVLDYGVTMTPTLSNASGAVDDTVWHGLTVTNVGVYDDEYTIGVAGQTWATTIWDADRLAEISTTGILVADESIDILARVIIPVSNYGDNDEATLNVTSMGDSYYQSDSWLRTYSDGEPLTLPFTDEFATTEIDMARWVSNVGATVNEDGVGESSAPYSLNLDGETTGADTLSSYPIDLRDQSGLILTYYYQRTGGGDSPETLDDLWVEYFDTSRTWVEAQRYSGSGEDMTAFEFVRYVLPDDAYHSGFRVRFRNRASTGSFDDWFVDDVYVGLPPPYEMSLVPVYTAQSGLSGGTASSLLTIRNTGANADSYDLAASGYDWSLTIFDKSGANPLTSVGPVVPNDSIQIMIEVAIPLEADVGSADTALIEAVSQNDPGISGAVQVETSSSGLSFICGDIDNNDQVDVADLVYFVNYQFDSGPPPPIIEAADVNNTGQVDIADLVYLVHYMFDQPPGPEPQCSF